MRISEGARISPESASACGVFGHRKQFARQLDESPNRNRVGKRESLSKLAAAVRPLLPPNILARSCGLYEGFFWLFLHGFRGTRRQLILKSSGFSPIVSRLKFWFCNCVSRDFTQAPVPVPGKGSIDVPSPSIVMSSIERHGLAPSVMENNLSGRTISPQPRASARSSALKCQATVPESSFTRHRTVRSCRTPVLLPHSKRREDRKVPDSPVLIRRIGHG